MTTANRTTVLWGAAVAGALVLQSASTLAADAPMPKGFSSFGPDQTLADIGKLEWQPLTLEGLPPGAEVATLRGDLGKGGAEILVRVPAKLHRPEPQPHERRTLCLAEGWFHLHRGGRKTDRDGQPRLNQSSGQHAPRPEMPGRALHILSTLQPPL